MHVLIDAGSQRQSIMAYLFRGTQSTRDEPQFSNFSSNPLSPQRNPNRLSTGMMSSNDARVGLTRRFTMNALPTLSPIGQQRRQAAGDGQMVSQISSTQKPMAQHNHTHTHKQHAEEEVEKHGDMQKYETKSIEELLMGSEPSPSLLKGSGKAMVSSSGKIRVVHKRGKSCWRAIGDGRPEPNESTENGQETKSGYCAIDPHGELVVFWLTPGGKPTGTYSRVAPVSTFSLFDSVC